MIKTTAAVILILWTHSLSAQRIQGTVFDKSNGQSVPGASVQLGKFNSTSTNDSGYFSLPAKEGKQEVRISSIGFRTRKATLLADGNLQQVSLERMPLFMEPVEIRSTRASDQSPFTKTNIDKQEIEKNNLGQDLPFILSQLPSVVINSDAGNGIGYTGIRIRGSDATRINMTINGIPYNDAESQGLYFVDLPDLASSLQSIQVQRGVGTSSNGAGAFGATINFSTNELNVEPYATSGNSIGSYNTWKTNIKAGSGLIDEHFTIDARLSKISSDGYVDRASSDLKSFYISAAYIEKATSVRANIFSGTEKTYQAWYGITAEDLEKNRRINYAGMEKPGSPYDNETDNYQQDHFQFFVNHKFSEKLLFNTALFLTKGQGYYEQYKAAEAYSDYGLANPIYGKDTLNQTDLIRQLWLKNKFYGQVVSLQYKSGKHELIGGGGWNRYSGNHFGTIPWAANGGIPDHYRWYDLHANKSDFNAFIKYQYAVSSHLFLFGDLQVRNINYNIQGFRDHPDINISNTYHFVNPKFGITYMLGGKKLYASYALAQKEPNRDDFESGINQQPKPENLHDIEIGLERKSRRYEWGVTLYNMYYLNQLVLTGKINDVGAYTRTNIPKSVRMGIELQGQVKPAAWIQAAANLTVSHNRIYDFTEFLDDFDNGGQKNIPHRNTTISYSPPFTGAVTLTLFPVKNVALSFLSKYAARQFLDNTSNRERSLNPFLVEDVRLSYRLVPGILKDITCTLLISNLFNTRYSPNGYSYTYFSGNRIRNDNYYFPMAGTNVLLGLQVKF